MLRVFRIRACCLVTVVCLATGTFGASLELLLHAGPAHVDACVPAAAAPHDASAHRIQASTSGQPPGGDDHCVACHLARSFRPRTESGPPMPPLDARGTLRVSSISGPALAPVLAHLAPRSPPPFV